MLISDNIIGLENMLERHLYENGAEKAHVDIDNHDDEIEVSIRCDDECMSFVTFNDSFEDEHDFYTFSIRQISKHLNC